jgi:hypothetical protein
MIRYALKCSDDHGFESWFKSADAFDTLTRAAMVVCPVCGSTQVAKAIMAPRVRPSRNAAQPPAPVPARPEGPLSKPASDVETALAALRKQVETNSDYVGLGFAAEARKMHDGDIPHRSIYGEARLDEAKKLLEDGVPVAPLPFIPQRKTN